ncbi:uncharacterized protein LOC116601414 [Nematostella vectensis]|uniref:uncharacterized protein LOC116601414 n=1 Tax=Nematostella vectensis TaxID=45351 RepID=UPI0020772D11|nr:uncharacterized protein LOC116601414 [Nematostella vectensis]
MSTFFNDYFKYAAVGALAIGGVAMGCYAYKRWYGKERDVASKEREECKRDSIADDDIIRNHGNPHETDAEKTVHDINDGDDTSHHDLNEEYHKKVDTSCLHLKKESDECIDNKEIDKMHENENNLNTFLREFDKAMLSMADNLFCQGRSLEELRQAEMDLGPLWPMIEVYRDMLPD